MIQEYRQLLVNGSFKYLWISQLLSQLAINMMNFVLLLRVFEKTESTVATSLLWVAYALPAVFFGPIGAASVDLLERRKVLMITNLLQSIVIFTYSLFHISRTFLVYSVVVGYSFLNQFYVPAEAAALPALVRGKQLASANGLFFMTQQASLVLGFGFAGILYKFIGFTDTLALCASFLFVAFISVSFLPSMRTGHKLSEKFEKNFFLFFERIMEGYNFIKSNKSILLPFLVLLGFQAALSVVMIIIPVVATDLLHIELQTSGAFIVAPAGIGALFGALLVPRLLRRGWRKKKVIQLGVAGIIVALTCLLFVGLHGNLLVRLLLTWLTVILAGMAFIGVIIPAQTYLQEATPGGLRGRVFGNFWFLVTIVSIFPVLLSGALTEILSIRSVIVAFIVFALVVLAVVRRVSAVPKPHI